MLSFIIIGIMAHNNKVMTDVPEAVYWVLMGVILIFYFCKWCLDWAEVNSRENSLDNNLDNNRNRNGNRN